ncbi:MAG: hypothetical protein RLZZ450_7749 [Pseudomonadota bacterium]|jgi:hypothetical protein
MRDDEKLTHSEWKSIEEYRLAATARALDCTPLDDDERTRITRALRERCKSAGRAWHGNVIFVGSPTAGQLAASRIAEALETLREQRLLPPLVFPSSEAPLQVRLLSLLDHRLVQLCTRTLLWVVVGGVLGGSLTDAVVPFATFRGGLCFGTSVGFVTPRFFRTRKTEQHAMAPLALIVTMSAAFARFIFEAERAIPGSRNSLPYLGLCLIDLLLLLLLRPLEALAKWLEARDPLERALERGLVRPFGASLADGVRRLIGRDTIRLSPCRHWARLPSANREMIKAESERALRTALSSRVATPIDELVLSRPESLSLPSSGQRAPAELEARRWLLAQRGLEATTALRHKVEVYLDAGATGWCWEYRDFAVVSDRPCEMHTEADERGRLRFHRTDGPALSYRDGCAFYYVHGEDMEYREFSQHVESMHVPVQPRRQPRNRKYYDAR